MQNSQRISKKKIFFILGTFLLLLTALRVGWMFYYQPIEQPAAENGVIDLRDWDFNNNDVVTLDGEWKFIPNDLSAPLHLKNNKKMTSTPSHRSMYLAIGRIQWMQTNRNCHMAMEPII